MISFDFMMYAIKGIPLDNETLPNNLKIKISQTPQTGNTRNMPAGL
jgi:hypothetical protein